VFQIIAVSMYNSGSGESRHLVLLFLLMTGKFYTLGILRSLNSRPALRGRMTSDAMGRTSLSGWQWGDEHESSVSRRMSETPFLETASVSRGQDLCISSSATAIDREARFPIQSG